MPTENQNPIMSAMEKTVTRNLLKYAAGHCIFCPRCNEVMDWRKTVIIELYQGESLSWTYTVCVKCADQQLPNGTKAVEAKGFTVKVTDGRKFK